MFNYVCIKLIKLCGLLAIMTMFSGCAETYENATSFDLGYTTICTYDKSSAIITFRRYPLTSQQLAVDYLLYRAAEVTVEQHMDYFVVVSASPSDLGMMLQRNYKTYLLGKERFYHFSENAIRSIRSYPGRQPCCKGSFDSLFIAIKMYDEATVAGPMAFDAQELFGYFQAEVF